MTANEARISPQDRGFRFGDGVFETIPFYAKKLYQWAFHINRLAKGLAALQIQCEADWRAIADALITQNNTSDGFIRIAVSRGIGSRGYRPLPDLQPTVFVELLPRQTDRNEESLSLWLSGWRKPAPNALPAYKLSQGVNSTLALQEADTQSCNEALLLSHDGMLCEAASGNLFWIKDDILLTPTLETGCLNGATRHAIMRLHDVQEISAPLETLRQADAVFLSNCNWGIMPVAAIKPMGWAWSAQHPLIETLQQAYRDDIHASV